MIKYLGSKRTLIPTIVGAIEQIASSSARRDARPVQTVLDLFSGTARVGHALKRAGFRVLANDHNAYAATLARCYVQADAADVLDDARRLVRELNALRGRAGWFTETYCVRSRFFQPKNGARVDAIRDAIARKRLAPELEAVLLVSLMEAADRVDSTTGVQMAYLKQWAPRASNGLELRVPDVLPRARAGKGRAFQLDAFEAATKLAADVAYVDPPYNQHSYLGNYHVWESLVRWDKPEVYGVACKRVDVKERQSAFNSRPRFAATLKKLLASVQARALVVSFSDEGWITRRELESTLRELWNGEARVVTLAHDYKRYVGAQIGIYNPNGVKVGKVSHLRNQEFVHVATSRELAPPRTSRERALVR